ncbi:MAG TPA: hypothetical protein VF223_22105 [Trebonia sp.]
MNTSLDKRPIRPLLILGLACLWLLFPLLSVVVNLVGGSPALIGAGAERIWLLAGVAWILIVWLTRAPHPLTTLALTGLTGGILTVLVVGAIQLGFSGSIDILTSPIGVVALIALSTLGGLICGLIAWGLQSVTRKAGQ